MFTGDRHQDSLWPGKDRMALNDALWDAAG